MKKYILLFVYIITLNILKCPKSYSQSTVGNIIYIENGPVKNGYFFVYNDEKKLFKEPLEIMYIYSNDSIAFSLSDGNITLVSKKKEHSYYITVQNSNNDTVFIYGNIDKPFVQINDSIKKGAILGQLGKVEYFNNSHALILAIATKQLKFLSYAEIMEYLKEYFIGKDYPK